MATFYKAHADRGIRWWNSPAIPDMPKHFALVVPSLEPSLPPPPPRPPRLVMLLPEETPRYARIGPLSRAQTRTVLARLRQHDIPTWARPHIMGALAGAQITLYINDHAAHAMVWLALHRLGAQQSTLPVHNVWLTGSAITKWSEGRGEPIRRRTLTGITAANRARLNAEECDGQP